jgi:predicted CXXCH cytochrome family protein
MRSAIGLLFQIGLVAVGSEWYSLAQDFDAVLSSQNRKPVDIVDQIEDPQERKAFLSLCKKIPPNRKALQAEAFLNTFPQSWFLAQAYEIASKSYIDLEDYDRALRYGEASLQLLPENPLLLVPIANVQAQKSLTTKAKQSATDALELLERFGRSSSVPEGEWPSVEQQLRGSCFFVLGRVALLEASAETAGQRRRELLYESERYLSQARSFNPADSEIDYARGLTHLSLGNTELATVSFAVAYELGGPMQSKALEQLRLIYERSHDKDKVSFEGFLRKAQSCIAKLAASDSFPSKKQTVPPLTNATGLAANEGSLSFAGSKACQSCHVEQYEAWEKSGMSRMLRPYRMENVIGRFGENVEFYASDEVSLLGSELEIVEGQKRVPFARMVLEQGRHYFQIRHRDGKWVRYSVDYTIGSKWQQAYATRLLDGEIHVFPIQYNAIHQRWINFWKLIDPAGSERADVTTFEKLDRSTSYQANCAVCHTSQLRNTTGSRFDAAHLEFREPGINCEMCHGPSGQHVTAMMGGQPIAKQPLDPPIDFTRISYRDYLAICAQCHMQSALRDPGPNGELNYSGRAGVFFKLYKSRPLAEFSRKAFYKDGRFRETTFIVEALQRSACFKRGQASCGHCHDPHRTDIAVNENSLKFVDRPDQLCLQCHVQFASEIESHSGHRLQSEGSRCVSCHMPKVMNSLMFKSRTHQIDDIPNLESTLRFGPEESPNACLLCHKERGTDWLKIQLEARHKKLLAQGTRDSKPNDN